MADIKVTIEQPQKEQEPQTLSTQPDKVAEPVNKNAIKMNLKLRRSLDGNIMIFDHNNIDIVISPKSLKVIAFAKDNFSDHVYAAQNRLFEFLIKKGIIEPKSVKGGHVYGSIEGSIFKPKDDLILDQLLILNVGKWIEEEKPHMEFDKHYEDFYNEYLTDPDDEDSTELGEVPQEEEKGTVAKTPLRRYTGGYSY